MIRVETCPDGLLEINIEGCEQENYLNNLDEGESKDEGQSVEHTEHRPILTRVIVNKKTLRNKRRQTKDKEDDNGVEETSDSNDNINKHVNRETSVGHVNSHNHITKSPEYCRIKVEDEFFHEEGYASDNNDGMYVGDVSQENVRMSEKLKSISNVIASTGDVENNPNISTVESKKTKSTNSKPYVCDICNKTISIAANFNRHKRKHEMEAMGFQCKVCMKAFTGWNSLRSHMMIHSNIKPYACKYCPKTFRQKNQVTVHTRIHTQERPFVCKYCNASFIQSSAHLAHVRVHEGIRLHRCTYCDKAFTEKGSLNRHTRIHTHERPHACDLCHRLFVDRTGMLRHRRSHTKDRPYSCTICPKSFTRKENIKRHIGTAHKDVEIVLKKPPLIKIPPELLKHSQEGKSATESCKLEKTK